MTVLVLTGPPGVGKTTVARNLAARHERAVHVEADRFFFFIRSGLIEPWDPASDAQNQMAMRIAATAAAGYAQAGYMTILDGIVIPRWTLGVVRATLEAAGLEVAYAVLRAPQADCTARVHEREGSPDIFDPEILAAIGAEFGQLGELERCAVDVTGKDGERAAAAVAERLAAGDLTL